MGAYVPRRTTDRRKAKRHNQYSLSFTTSAKHGLQSFIGDVARTAARQKNNFVLWKKRTFVCKQPTASDLCEMSFCVSARKYGLSSRGSALAVL